jgi:hypothetical protein
MRATRIPLHRPDAGDNGDFTKNGARGVRGWRRISWRRRWITLRDINGLKRIDFVMKNGLVYRRP